MAADFEDGVLVDERVAAWKNPKGAWPVMGTPSATSMQILDLDTFDGVHLRVAPDGLRRITVTWRNEVRGALVTNSQHMVDVAMLRAVAGPHMPPVRRPFGPRELPEGVDLVRLGDDRLRLSWGDGRWAEFDQRIESTALSLGQWVVLPLDDVLAAHRGEAGPPVVITDDEHRARFPRRKPRPVRVEPPQQRWGLVLGVEPVTVGGRTACRSTVRAGTTVLAEFQALAPDPVGGLPFPTTGSLVDWLLDAVASVRFTPAAERMDTVERRRAAVSAVGHAVWHLSPEAFPHTSSTALSAADVHLLPVEPQGWVLREPGQPADGREGERLRATVPVRLFTAPGSDRFTIRVLDDPT